VYDKYIQHLLQLSTELKKKKAPLRFIYGWVCLSILYIYSVIFLFSFKFGRFHLLRCALLAHCSPLVIVSRQTFNIIVIETTNNTHLSAISEHSEHFILILSYTHVGCLNLLAYPQNRTYTKLHCIACNFLKPKLLPKNQHNSDSQNYSEVTLIHSIEPLWF